MDRYRPAAQGLGTADLCFVLSRSLAHSHHHVVLQQLSRLELEVKSVCPGGVNVTVTDTNRRHCAVSAWKTSRRNLMSY